MVYRDKALSSDFVKVVAEVQEIFGLASQYQPAKSWGQHGAFASQESTSGFGVNSAFTATLQNCGKDSKLSRENPNRGRSANRYNCSLCICGGKHRFINCAYIFIENRGKDFKVKPEIEKQVKEKLESTIINNVVGNIGKENKMTCPYRSMTNIYPAFPRDKVNAGDQQLDILSFSTHTVNITIDGIPGTITLKNTTYVPTFHTNVTSLDLFIRKGCNWSVLAGRVTYNDNTVCDVQRKYGQFVIEYNPVKKHASAFLTSSFVPCKPSKASLLLWHKLLKHLSSDAIKQLRNCTNDAVVESLNPDKLAFCEVCHLSNST